MTGTKIRKMTLNVAVGQNGNEFNGESKQCLTEKWAEIRVRELLPPAVVEGIRHNLITVGHSGLFV